MPWSILTRARTSLGGNRHAAPDLNPRGPERRHPGAVGATRDIDPPPLLNQ
jgi:hypothetical protein